MDVSPQDPVLVAMDLSKTYSPLTRGHPEAVDLAKKPEWYHRRPPGCSADVSSTFRSRASASYGPPPAPVHRRDVEQRPDVLGSYVHSALAPGLDLFHERVRGSLWHAGFCGPDRSNSPVPESSGGDESDSGSDVIFLVSSAEEPLLCGSFIQDGVGHVVAPLSPASLDQGTGCYLLPPPLSSDSSDSSDSSVEIPVHHARPVVLLSDLNAAYADPAESRGEVSSDDSDVVEVSVTDSKKNNPSPPGGDGPSRRRVRRSSRRKAAPEPARFSCGLTRRSLKRRVKNDAVGIYNENCDSDALMELAEKFSSSDEVGPQTVLPARPEEPDPDVWTDGKSPEGGPKTKQPLAAPQPVHRSAPRRKRTAVRRRRKKRRDAGPSVLFPPGDVDVLLKFLQTKEPRKGRKPDGFCPFVHVDRRVCRVVNYQDESSVQTGPQRHALPGFVPCTSCFQLGRPGSAGSCRAQLRCCLCGQTANVLGLGDLHGPYCPTGTSEKGPTCRTEQEDFQNLSNGCLQNSEDGAGTPCPRSTKVPAVLDERWVHEDCSIWAAGVFLVRGKLYGLEEAARLAQDTVCWSCRQTGAIMGCFQKGCSRNYHCTCAVQSGCVLNHDNFTMRCPEHKNKIVMTTSRQDRR